MKKSIWITLSYLMIVIYNASTLGIQPEINIESLHVYLALLAIILLVLNAYLLKKKSKIIYMKFFEWTIVVAGTTIFLIESLNLDGFFQGFARGLFALFISPLYGLNRFIDVSYPVFSLFISVYFLIILMIMKVLSKESRQSKYNKGSSK